MIDGYLEFLRGLGGDDVVRIFWFYFIFELPRYVVMDYLVLVFYLVRERASRPAYAEARRKLHIERPLVSVIVPGKDEGSNYWQLAHTLAEQSYQNYELIVVDDGSSDDSPTIGRTLEELGKIDLFLRNEVRGGKASAANLALRYASGSFVVHLDADTSLDRDALERILIPFYLDERIGAVGGSICARNGDRNLCTMLQSIEYYLTMTVGRQVAAHLGILRIISGAFGAFRREILDRVGGWDIGPGLDGDLTVKVRKAGYRIHFEHRAIALTDVPTSFPKLAKQRRRWERSLIRFRLRKHVNVFFAQENFSFSNFFSFLENLFFNLVLTLSWYVYIYDALIHFTDQIGYIILTNILLYTASNFLAFGAFILLTKRWKGTIRLVPYLPLMVFYMGYFMRVVRSVSYFTEFFFKASYRDPWNPVKTSRMALRYKL